MILLRRSKLLRWIILTSLIIIANIRASSPESSGEYLQKVMIELQELNVPSNVMIQDPLNVNYQHISYQNDHVQDNAYRKLSTNEMHEQLHQDKHQKVQKPNVITTSGHIDTAQSASNNVVQYYAVRNPAASSHTKVKQPEPLAFTRAELAAMYKKALEKGSAINLSSLTHALAAGNAPQVAGSSHMQIPVKYPMYNYYFFPLKTFASELQRDHGYQAMVVPAYEAAETVQNNQKQLMNPLFLAIGTFISMALLFMMGVLFVPKLPHFELFNARAAEDDFLRLTTFVMNAIDRRNILD